jgi:hypothetical protein
MDWLRVFVISTVLGVAEVSGAAQSLEPFLKDGGTAQLVAAYQQADQGYNSGRGESGSVDSGVLGWNESYRLRCYWELYELTGDHHWLDQLASHTDRMFANLSLGPDKQILPWRTDLYGRALIRAEAEYNRGTGSIQVPTPTITDPDKAKKVPKSRYILEFRSPERFVVTDSLSGLQVGDPGAYKDGADIAILPDVKVRIHGKPMTGDVFTIETLGSNPLPYIVHQGMVLIPIARFIEAAIKDPALAPYRSRAEGYLKTIETVFLLGNEKYWIETGDGAGAYRWSADPTERSPNRILPHNQYLALGTAWLILGDVSQNQLFRRRAKAMAMNFKRALRPVGDVVEWNYCDFMEPTVTDVCGMEDVAHGAIDVGFAEEALARHVVFTGEDLRRFARTFVTKIWNGDTQRPFLGDFVNTSKGDTTSIYNWVELATWEPRILDIAKGVLVARPGTDKDRALQFAITYQAACKHCRR